MLAYVMPQLAVSRLKRTMMLGISLSTEVGSRLRHGKVYECKVMILRITTSCSVS
jgi:hypothetical protein